MERTEAKEKVKREIPITRYLTKSKSGLYCCPVCDSGTGPNGTGAVKVYPDNTICCFACTERNGKKAVYDVFDLEYNRQTGQTHPTGEAFNEILSSLAEEIGVEIDAPAKGTHHNAPKTNFKNEGQESTQKTEKPLKTQNTASQDHPADFTEYYKKCSDNLKEPAAVNYLIDRGIHPETAAAFGIGYDPQADPASAPGGVGEIKHPAKRIIIPTCSSHYVARAIDADTAPGFLKMNPKGASPDLFNGDIITQEVQEVFVVEGAFDALSLAEAKVQAVALNSTSNTAKLLDRVKEHPGQTVYIICLDNDAAGQKATAELVDGFQSMNIPFVCRNLSGPYKDPNEYLTMDRSGFVSDVKDAQAAAALLRDPTGLESFMQEIYTKKYKPVPTGLESLDNYLHGGLLPGTLFLLGAEPGSGKTALASQIFESMAEAGQPGIYLNLEMSRQQLLARSLARRIYAKDHSHALTALDILQGYKQTDTTRQLVTEAAAEYRQAIGDRLQYNPAGIGADVETILDYIDRQGKASRAAGKPAPNICIDYLQIVTATDPRADSAETIKRTVAGLKEYAEKYHAIVFAIMSQSRGVNNLKEATLSAGRDTSALEYTADVQAQLIRGGPDNKNNPDPDTTTLYITKSRFTESSTTKGLELHFAGGQSMFEAVGEWTQSTLTPFDTDTNTDTRTRL